MRNRILLVLAAVLISGSVLAQNSARQFQPDATPPVANNQPFGAFVSEDFADIATLPGAGWSLQNLSNPIGTTDWFQGNDTVFPAQAGAPTAYIGANFNNTAGGTGVISNWLITPEFAFGQGAEVRFWTRVPTGGSQFPDRLEVRLSAAGASTDVGASETSVGDFTTVLITVNPSLLTTAGSCPPVPAEGYPEAWCEIVLTTADGIPSAGTGRVGFRYFVDNAGPAGTNSNFIGIDTVDIVEGQPIPENTAAVPVDQPWALALMALLMLAFGAVIIRRMF